LAYGIRFPTDIPLLYSDLTDSGAQSASYPMGNGGYFPEVSWLVPKRDDVTGEWRKLHNEELHDFYSSPSTIRIMKSRKMRWAGHVA
jgi:hypothetical protein